MPPKERIGPLFIDYELGTWAKQYAGTRGLTALIARLLEQERERQAGQ